MKNNNNNNNSELKLPSTLLNMIDEVHAQATAIYNNVPQEALELLPNKKIVTTPPKKNSNK